MMQDITELGEDNVVCNLCENPGNYSEATDVAQVYSNVREFRHQRFTVWRCTSCQSLHSKEAIDFERYYANYPLRNQKRDFYTRIGYGSRLRRMVKAGLRKEHRILDYGCGNGNFLRYLIENGYLNSFGYDPFVNEFSSPSVLDRKYDFVSAQDVLEHHPHPKILLTELASYVSSEGVLSLGTPNASCISLHSAIDRVGVLHQPYHQHIFSKEELERQMASLGFEPTLISLIWYFDTWMPFANSAFLFRYLMANGGVLDAGFEPIRFGLILRSPSLLFYGLLGRLFARLTDMTIFFKNLKQGVKP
jgi:2-polyprenyl-3-methyl-5-hydroxy-6-metoxy-1,4-benzoquinol methylase